MSPGRSVEQIRAIPDDDRARARARERSGTPRAAPPAMRTSRGDRARRSSAARSCMLQAQHRAIGLVGLHHQPLALAPPRVGKIRHPATRRSASRRPPGGAQNVHEHRGRRRLAVRPGDGDRAPKRCELPEELGARSLASPRSRAAARSTFSAGHRRGEDDLDPVACGDVVARMADRSPRGSPSSARRRR